MANAQETYEALTQKFLSDMMAVKAPIADYLEALRGAVDDIEMAIDAAEMSTED